MLGLGSSLVTGGGVQGLIPSDISGLEMWLKFNTGIVANSGNTSDAGNMDDAEDINSWADQSGNSRNAAQTSASKKPHWEDDEAGTVYFHDPAAQVMLNIAQVGSADISINAEQDFTLIARVKTTNFDSARAILGHNSNNVLKIGNNKTITTLIGGTGSSVFAESSDTLATDTYYTIMLVRSNGSTGNLNVYVHGGSYTTLGGKDWDSTEGATDTHALTISNVGAGADTAIEMLGFFKDVLIYKGTALDTGQRADIISYLSTQT